MDASLSKVPVPREKNQTNKHKRPNSGQILKLAQFNVNHTDLTDSNEIKPRMVS